MENLGLVDRIISPYESITSAILHYLRSRDVRAATLLHDLPGELLEIELPPASRYAGQAVSDIRFPSGSIVAVVQRGGGVIPATGELRFEAGDRLLVFADPAAVRKIKAMFRK